MIGKYKKPAVHFPEPSSAHWKLFELAMGPRLMLLILLALGVHLFTSNGGGGLGLLAQPNGLAPTDRAADTNFARSVDVH